MPEAVSRRPDTRLRGPCGVLFPLLFAVLAVAGCAEAVPSTTSGPPSSLTTTTTVPTTTTVVNSTSTTVGPSSTTTSPRTTSPPTTVPGSVSVSTPDGTVGLSPAQAAGQRVIYSYPGLTPPSQLLALIRRGEVAGVFFFSANIASVAQIRLVIAQLETANGSATNPIRAPLLLLTDQEGGAVRRLPGPPLLSEKEIGAAKDPLVAAAQAGREAGLNLKSAGMNVNLAPVLDVYRQAGNFIDKHGRSYSRDPALVSELGAGFIRAQQEEGVLATVKHFPGLGSAAAGQDTDVGPVTLKVSLKSLRATDEAPYRAALDSGAQLVMLSWAVYPALDPALPAGLSAKVVQEELRGRFKFQGVTITDALAAGALKEHGSLGRRAVLAARAGMDLMLASAGDLSGGVQVRDALAQALSSGSLTGQSFQESVQRLLDLRFSLAR